MKCLLASLVLKSLTLYMDKLANLTATLMLDVPSGRECVDIHTLIVYAVIFV